MFSTKKSLLQKLGCNKAVLSRPPFNMPHRKQDGREKLVSILIKNLNSKSPQPSSSSKTEVKNGNVRALHSPYAGPAITKKFPMPPSRTDAGSFNNQLKKQNTEVKNSVPTESSTVNKPSKSKSLHPTKTFICKFCCRRFFSLELLQEHTSTHGSKPTHVCYLCGHQTASFSALMTHYLKHSGTKGCKIDKIMAKSKADFNNIQFNISSRQKTAIRCIHCKVSFSTEGKFDIHDCMGAEKKKEYNCAYCGKISKSVTEYRDHVLSHSVTPFMCTFCGSKFQTKKALDRHCDSCPRMPQRGRPRMRCSKCNIQFKKRFEFNKHVEECGKKVIAVPKEFTCLSCSSKFGQELDYKNHVSLCQTCVVEEPAVELPKKSFSCSVCSLAFDSNSELNLHCQTCKTPETKEPELQSCITTQETEVNLQSKVTPAKKKPKLQLCTTTQDTEVNLQSKITSAKKKSKLQLCTTTQEKEVNVLSKIKPAKKKPGRKPRAITNKRKTEVQSSLVPEEKNLALPFSTPVKEQPELQTETVVPELEKAEPQLCTTPEKRKSELQSCTILEGNEAENEQYLQENLTPQRRSARLVDKKFSFSPEETETKKKRSPKNNIFKNLKVVEIEETKIKLSPQKIKKVSSKVKKNEKVASFLCNICDFSFCSKSSLIRHKRMHSGDPWFCCKYCGKLFFRKDVFIRHEMNVHNKGSNEVLSCCYCKLYFNTSPALKDHVLATHKENAFLQTKQRKSTSCLSSIEQEENKSAVDIKPEIFNNIKIKSETALPYDFNFFDINDNDSSKTAQPSSLGINDYKCGVCLISFITLADLKKHLSEVHDAVESNETENTSFPDMLVDIVNNTKCLDKNEMETSETAVNVNCSNALNKLANDEESFVGNEDSEINDKFQRKDSDNELNECPEAFPDATFEEDFEPLPHTFSCKMCSKSFSNENLLNAHSETAHRLVEWFQCLVCDSSGPKEDMQTHMMNHMYKVGTFIVNSNKHNFDCILPCLPEFTTFNSTSINPSESTEDSQSNKSDLNSSISEIKSSTIVESNCQEYALPPLREINEDVNLSIVNETSSENVNFCPQNTNVVSNQLAEDTMTEKDDCNLSQLLGLNKDSNLCVNSDSTENIKTSDTCSDALDLTDVLRSTSNSESVNANDILQYLGKEADLFSNFDSRNYCFETDTSFSDTPELKASSITMYSGTDSVRCFSTVNDIKCNKCHLVFSDSDSYSKHICMQTQNSVFSNLLGSSSYSNSDNTNIFQNTPMLRSLLTSNEKCFQTEPNSTNNSFKIHDTLLPSSSSENVANSTFDMLECLSESNFST